MNRTLSVLVPVSNAQATIGRLVGQLLEILPELTSKFEMAVIDLGSTDDTAETAHELALAYPQISTLSLPRTANLTTVLRRGLANTAGDFVLLLEPDCQADLNELPKLWAMAQKQDLVVGIARQISAEGLPSAAPKAAVSRLRMIQRRVTWAWASAEIDETLDAYLARKRYRVSELPIRACRSAATVRPAANTSEGMNRRLVDVTGKPGRIDPPTAGSKLPVAVKRPTYLSYLSRFKTFALGE